MERVPRSRAALHDLRNLMTAMGGYLPELRSGRLEPHAGLALAALVEHAMTLSRQLHRPTAPPIVESVDVAHMLGKLSPVIQGMVARSARLHVSTVGTPRARAHRGSLEGVVLNLVTNAAQASGPDGSIVVVGRPAGSSVIIEVSNDGPVLDPQILEAVFTESAQPSIRGLGLAIVRDNLALLGASLRVTSSPARTSFQIEVPAEEG